MPSLEDLTIQQQRSLRSAAVNLQRDFDGVFSIETIEQFLPPATSSSPPTPRSSRSFR